MLEIAVYPFSSNEYRWSCIYISVLTFYDNKIIFNLEDAREGFSNKVNVLLEILGEEVIIFDEAGSYEILENHL